MPIKLGEVEIEAESDRRDEVGGGAAAEVADGVEGGAAGQVVAFAADGRLDVIELHPDRFKDWLTFFIIWGRLRETLRVEWLRSRR